MEIIQPTLFVVSAPSGAGKTTIIKRALESIPHLVLSVSHTSRHPRQGESHAKDYFFISAEEFRKKIENGDFLEWAIVHGNYYGTSRVEILRLNKEGKLVILDIDVQGAQQLKNNKGIKSIYIFIEPPSMEELRKRLENRHTESPESIEIRIQNAREELRHKVEYDFVIVNDDLETAVKSFENIIKQNASGAISVG